MLLPWKDRRWLVWLVVASAGAAWGASASPTPVLVGEPGSARRTPLVVAIERAMPAVVSITSEKRANSNSRWPFSSEESGRPRVSGMGTGVILDPRGFVLTNQHVVDRVQDLRVILSDGSSYPGRVLQEDPEMDLALVRVDAGRPLPAIAIGSSEDLMIGETVITIGNAFGYENTTSVGIISYIGRDITLADDQVYRNLIQTDAGINPGNSGGPLLNIDGELIGINVATRAGAQGLGFALPIDDVKPVAAEMISTRRMSGTYHGLVAAERLIEGARRVVVSAIEGGSPAEEAGLRPGDAIVRVGDLQVTNPIDIERGLLGTREPATLIVERGGRREEIALTPRPLARTSPRPGPPADPAARVWGMLGLRAMPVSADYVRPAAGALNGGLYVREIYPGGPADLAQIRPGDILVGINVGEKHLETVKPDNVLFILQQLRAAGAGSAPYYIVRNNTLLQGTLHVPDAGASATSMR